MSTPTAILSIEQSCEAAVIWARRQLEQAGLQVLRTFDLQSTWLSQEDCPCPHHGSASCDCRIVVLLVYGVAPRPATLIVHARDRQAYFSLVEAPEPVDVSLQGDVRRALLVRLPLNESPA